MSEVVQMQIEDGVALLTLNRPERLNAWTQEMEHAYFGLLAGCAEDERVRAIVVTGAGRGFCAGADMQQLQALGDAAQPADAQPPDAHAAAPGNGAAPAQTRERLPQSFPLTIPKPIVAAINGACAGIGLVQALMCDLRFAARGAKLTTAFARRGLVAEHGIAWMLPRLVGPARALDLLLSGRVVLAEEAHELGLVNRVASPEALLEETLAYARDMAVNCSPASMATMKSQVYADLARPLPDALAAADELMLASFAKPDFVEGVASFVERREPRFAAYHPAH
ncbi:MAG TPA: enoyl-CoA hydratase [Solirubrobacteraceae bacterium]|jgi:enoyl-CoA hydratase/carnithine racemase|nr:enoyl-CoA hydratase [Solirubrobacteraceae bacterium]